MAEDSMEGGELTIYMETPALHRNDSWPLLLHTLLPLNHFKEIHDVFLESVRLGKVIKYFLHLFE